MAPSPSQNPHNHHPHHHPHHPPEAKGTFEKYQLFFGIVIAAVLVVAGILIARFVPAKGGNAGIPQGGAITQSDVRSDLVKVAKKIGVNTKQFSACLDDGTNTEKISEAVALAQKSGVQGTPTFFILKRTVRSDGTIASQRQFTVLGARDKETFLKAIADGRAPADQPVQTAGQKIVLSDNDHYQGPKDAETVIVEYADIDCPFCKAERPVIDEILKEHPEFAHVFRHAPIASLHHWAEYKAAGAECVATLGGQEAFSQYLSATMQ